MKLIPDYLKESFERYADKTAYVDRNGTRKTTYEELDKLSSAIAAGLAERGCKKGDVIPVLMPRCVEYIAAEIAILKIGGLFVALNADYPAERVEYILGVCGADFLIDSEFVEACRNKAPLKEFADVSEKDGGYVIFTSGSTGRPKGIRHSHGAFVSYIIRQQMIEDYKCEDVRTNTAANSFSVSVKEHFVALITGSTVHILSDEVRKDIRAIEDYIAKNNITVAYLNPGQLRLFRNKSKTLRLVVTVGERLVDQYSTDYRILNYYGTSEVSTALSFVVDKKYPNTPIGKPCHGVSAYILDDDLKPVKDGEEGELCIAGPIADGYIGLPEQTAAAFVENPFSTCEADRIMFRTNDIVKALPDGNIVFINRKDWMVKINGQRVEPGEIETVIQSVEGVTAAVVKAFTNDHGQTYLVGYFVGENVSSDDVVSHLKNFLPDYMIPLFCVKLEKFPLNPNGKIDRLSLTPPDVSQYKKEYKAPSNDTEALLCDEFENILKCGTVGVDDDFFELGGDSIKTMMLQNNCNISSLTTEIVFEFRTPSRIAEAITAHDGDVMGECVGTNYDTYPLTASQMGIYLACIKNPTGTMYNLPRCYTFDKCDGIDIEKLIQAIEKAVENHESLSFSVDALSGTPVMRRCKNTVSVPIIPIENDALEEEKRNFVRPFDLSNDPLFRFAIFETEDKYTLIMDIHHIAFDGMSVAVFCDEISKLYLGEEIEKEGIGQFGLSLYEEKLPDTDKYKAAEKYYEEIFSTVENESRIAPDISGEKDGKNPAERFERALPDKLSSERVASFVKSHKITENALFLGAYHYAAAKFLGQEEVVICTVNHGRHDSRMKNTLGMMVRTMPLYAYIDETCKTVSFLSETEQKLHKAIAYDCYPFTEIATKYSVSADLMFVYQSDAFNTLKLGEKTLYMERIPVSNAVSPITFMMFKSRGGYIIEVEYRTDLYEYDTVRSFVDMYVQVLSEMLTKDSLSDIILVDDSAKDKITRFNVSTHKSVDLTYGFIDMFADQVKRTPDNTALVYKNNKYTYKQLDDITDRLAAYIKKKGCGKDDAISVLTGRNEYMTICSIGILKAGCAYQPLDPTYPAERLCFMVKDAGAKILIAQESLVGIITDFDGDILKIEDIKELPASDVTLESPAPDDLFILLYTSGSTGTPKGVMLMHKNLTNFIHWSWKMNEITEQSATAAYASYGFDAHMMDIYPYLSAGATEYIIPEENRLDLVYINEFCRENKITNMFMTTQVARAFLTSIDDIAPRIVSTGGETLVPFTPPTGVKVINGYGPTECTIFTTAFEVDKYYSPIPIGKGLNNTHLYVVDKQLRMLPVGATGELCIAGPLVSRGYLNRPEQTEKTYVSNPFDTDDAFSALYHTGDIVKIMNDGNVSYVGRRDGMVKIRGFRIELSEVETVIRDYPETKDATVVAKELPTGGKMIAAYIVSDNTVDIEDLKRFIAEQKPSYMIPEAIMQIDKIPLNVNGKVDKRNLPQITVTKAEKSPTSDRPKTSLETQILGIVEKIIGSGDVDIAEDLMDAGLTSVSVIKLSVEINKAFGIGIEIQKLLSGCSIIDIEDMIVGELIARSSSVPSCEQSDICDKYPLTQTQFGVYSECLMDPESTVYNIPLMYKLGKKINADRLEDALKTVINAHPSIKCSISPDDDGNIYMFPKNDDDVIIGRYSGNDDDAEEMWTEFVKPFDFAKGPFYRLSIFETGENIYLFTDFHHIMFDGESRGVFITDLNRVLNGEKLDGEEKSIFDVAKREEKARASEAYKKAKKYYDELLKGSSGCTVPKNDLDGETEICEKEAIHTPRLSSDAVKAFCEKCGVTPNAFFVSCIGFVLSKYAYSEDAVFTTVYNGRGSADVKNMFGMLVKTLPVRCETELERDVAGYVKDVSRKLLSNMAHDVYSFAEISHAYGIKTDFLFAYQGEGFGGNIIGGEEAFTKGVTLNRAKADISISLFEDGGSYVFETEYRANKYTKASIERLVDIIVTAAESMLTAEKLLDISVTSEKQCKIVEGFNNNDYEIEVESINKLFERHAASHPDKTAVISNGESLTYGELNGLANRLAHSLVEKGVKLGQIVGLVLDRSKFVYITEQGIMKAGAAFLPMIPDYPDDRIDYCLKDADCPFVITTEDVKAQRTELWADKPYKVLTVEELIKNPNDSNLDLDIPTDSLAYCIYTSGSTGTPKGVMIEHKNICTYVKSNRKTRQGAEDDDVSLAISAITFDASILDSFIPFGNGMTVCMANDEEIHNPLQLAELIKKNNVNIIGCCTPSLMMNIIEIKNIKQVFEGIKEFNIGAEAFPVALYDKIHSINPEAKVYNMYGPTECTICCAVKEVDSGSITIGAPAANVKFFVTDKKGTPMPIGISGELIICGDYVGRGYVKLPEKTKEVFFEYNGIRAYHSGDLARWNASGEIEYLGRLDNQVKLRGLRIELDEIENAINDFDGVKMSKVVVKNNGSEDFLAAYFTAEKQIDIDELTSSLKARLTYYMVPNVMLQLDEMPITVNGKIDKKRLPEIEYIAAEREYVEPKVGLEKELCNKYSEILGVEKVGATDSFFEIGGTSLSATKLVMFAVNQGYNVVYKDVFDNPTPRDMARFIEGGEKTTAVISSDPAADYDYTAINKIMSVHTVDNIDGVEKKRLGDIIVTGATGFLGIHIVKSYLDNYSGKVYCLIRKGRHKTPDNRLNNLFVYYFSETYTEAYKDRVICVEGDITDRRSLDKFNSISADTVINCAACVKHFVKDDILDRINVEGVENLIDACRSSEKRLIQISTTSVCGAGDEKLKGKILCENDLYFGQIIDNDYVRTKFLAERAVLSAVAEDGFDGQVVRVGNLMSRRSDGEFQINFITNSFMRTLKAYKKLGKFPMASLGKRAEFSPIDSTASAILAIAASKSPYKVFHAYNNNSIRMADVIYAMRDYGFDIDIVGAEEFSAALSEATKDESKSETVLGLVAYNKNDANASVKITPDNELTTNILYRLDYKWPIIDDDYLCNAIRALDTLGYFD